MSSSRRPGPFAVSLLASLAFGMVMAFATGHLNEMWVLWLACFLTMELWAAINRVEGATLSERTWAWLGIRPQEPLRMLRVPTVAVFLLELTLHFMTGGIYPWSGGLAVIVTASPLSLVIGYSLAFEGRKEP